MAYNNPWGKGNREYDKWFSNQWSDDQWLRAERNGNKGNSINVLNVASTANVTEADKNPEWLRYTTKDGDTYSSIVKKFGLIVWDSELASYNGKDPNIQPKQGDILALPHVTNDYLDKVEKKLNEFTLFALGVGWKVAVSNLGRFRKGTGGIKKLDAKWLKSFSLIENAIQQIQEYFEEKCFSHYADRLEDGETLIGDGVNKQKGNLFWWNTVTEPGYIWPNEIDYACGSSTLTGIGKITLIKTGDILSVNGEVEFRFSDSYNWNPGDSVPLPSLNANVPVTINYDSDMILLEEFRHARPFEMVSSWRQNVRGTVENDTWSSNEIEIRWDDI